MLSGNFKWFWGLRPTKNRQNRSPNVVCGLVCEKNNKKLSSENLAQKSRFNNTLGMCSGATSWPIWNKIGTCVHLTDVINRAEFRFDRCGEFWATLGRTWLLVIQFKKAVDRPYHFAALPCCLWSQTDINNPADWLSRAMTSSTCLHLESKSKMSSKLILLSNNNFQTIFPVII